MIAVGDERPSSVVAIAVELDSTGATLISAVGWAESTASLMEVESQEYDAAYES
jgi:hypothetical protein